MAVSRREFLKSTTINTAALAAIPAIVSACAGSGSKKAGILETDDVLLFQGDSITDAGRDKQRENPNNGRSFGTGYAFLAACELLKGHAGKNLTIYNRGISGNKVYQLAERWEKDCLELNPDLVSILIGVNDYWHMRNGQYDGTVEIYESDYRALLQRTTNALPGITLVICQPFILTSTSAVDESWVEPFRAYQEAARRMADEFQAVWVPFQEVFDEATKHAPEVYWAEDGVHPTMAGAFLMSEAWLRSIP